MERRGLECVRDTGYPFEWLGMTGAAAGLDDAERIVLAYTDAMTRVVAVEGALFERVRVLLGDRGVVELTAAVAGYNCVSRFLVALDVGEMNSQGVEGWKVE